VVPNFVVQGLCPRGDGYGTGGRRLPDEINPVPYLTGTLGMPNAGEPHTGGCQIFMTHLPTPHLDGRYTVFGRVTDGLDVMARLQIGDTIQRVRRRP
jgi:cyclophilin family peptidyl-prolyl cis-trans isomerase